MNTIGRFLTAFAFVLFVAILAAQVIIGRAYKGAARDVCDFIDEHYYKSGEKAVRLWLKECRQKADSHSLWISRNVLVHEINRSLEALGVSHLALFTPSENRAIWENEAVDSGLRARYIEGFHVVFEVIKGSPGDRAGIRRGDVILGVNGQPVGVNDQVEMLSGRVYISRKDRELEVDVVARPLSVDLKPLLFNHQKDTAILRIPSFLGHYFERASWLAIAERLSDHQRLIIDLRGNAGGSFPGMLRALSVFFCDENRIGTIVQPKFEEFGREARLEDKLDTESQLLQLDGIAKLHLQTFTDYPCYDGPVTVLVDQETSSVAEIFADAFNDRPLSRVWGMPTAGQVVMAQWFPLSGLGAGDFSVSIPIAGYLTRRGNQIEDEGVKPERLLYYDLDRAVEGRDSWIEAAVANDHFRDGGSSVASPVSQDR